MLTALLPLAAITGAISLAVLLALVEPALPNKRQQLYNELFDRYLQSLEVQAVLTNELYYVAKALDSHSLTSEQYIRYVRAITEGSNHEDRPDTTGRFDSTGDSGSHFSSAASRSCHRAAMAEKLKARLERARQNIGG